MDSKIPSRFSSITLSGLRILAGAVHYALDGRKWTRVLDILERHWADLLVDHTGLVRTALQSIPGDVLSSNPSILVGRDLLESRLRPQLINGDSLPTEPAELRAIGGSPACAQLVERRNCPIGGAENIR